MITLSIAAPFSGWCASLEEVPDPVFAGRMLGDGLAVDPTDGLLVAPCAGEIVTLPASSHAVSIRTVHGIDILVHVGIDTVTLGGHGFEALVKPGARVNAGEPLIRFDLDVVARAAKSLMTPVVASGLEGMTLSQRHSPGLVAAGDVLFEISIASTHGQADPPAAADSPGALALELAPVTESLQLPLRLGLHARPAALLAQRAKAFAATIRLSAHGRTANARSVVSMMALGLRQHDTLGIEARGTDARQAVAAVIAALQEALVLESAVEHGPVAIATAPIDAAGSPREVGELNGIAAVAGFAVGRATRLTRRVIPVAEFGGEAMRERTELERALAHVRAQLQRGARTGGGARREILEAHVEFLDDPSLNEAADHLIASGKSAGFAWRTATRRSIEALQALDDARLRERADDLLDVESQVLRALVGETREAILLTLADAVLIAEDLLPSELAALDPLGIVAIGLGAGGATSHVAILAAAHEIPMLVGLGGGIGDIVDGAPVIVDADQGVMYGAPCSMAITRARAHVAARREQQQALRQAASADCYARDGTRVEIFANLGNIADAASAIANGAEGCGLLRTEFLFLDRETAPSEDEQLEHYQSIARELGGRPMILRLMDVGGDKPLPYLPLPVEENPALGLRGIRTALAHPDLLRAQLRAALRVTPWGQVRLLLPMITDVAEILAVRVFLAAELSALRIAGRIDLGAMIDTPASALIAGQILEQVDFLSVGSNDLTQYTLAMDRGHAQLSQRTDALHPAVLKLIAAAGAAGVAAQKRVAVCGGVAADRMAVPILLGLGVRELSVVPGAIPALKRQVRCLDLLECRGLALRCLELASASEVRALVSQTLSRREDVA